MSKKQKQKRNFKSMSYREVQAANSKNRLKLSKPDQEWLKKSGFKNIGWDNVINLYKQIELLQKESNYLDSLDLGELFLEADRIGNKYLTEEEIIENNKKLAEANNRVNEQIDKSFPDLEPEFIDFRNNSKAYNSMKSNIVKSKK